MGSTVHIPIRWELTETETERVDTFADELLGLIRREDPLVALYAFFSVAGAFLTQRTLDDPAGGMVAADLLDAAMKHTEDSHPETRGGPRPNAGRKRRRRVGVLAPIDC